MKSYAELLSSTSTTTPGWLVSFFSAYHTSNLGWPKRRRKKIKRVYFQYKSNNGSPSINGNGLGTFPFFIPAVKLLLLTLKETDLWHDWNRTFPPRWLFSCSLLFCVIHIIWTLEENNVHIELVLIVLYLFSLKLDKVDSSLRVRRLTVSVTQGSTPYNGLYGEAPHKMGTFSTLQVYERVGALLVEVHKRVRKSVIWVCKSREIWMLDLRNAFYQGKETQTEHSIRLNKIETI